MQIELRPSTVERLPCSDCGEVTEFVVVADADGLDRGERACVECGQARWVPTPGASRRHAAAAA